MDDDAFAQVRGILELDDLVQGVSHDRVGQAGADIAHIRAFFLRLLDRGIHEDRAARSQVNGAARFHCHLREVSHVGSHGLREGLQEGPAT